MKYSMKLAGILNETGPTLNENTFHSFVVAKQIFLWQLPQLHRGRSLGFAVAAFLLTSMALGSLELYIQHGH